MKIIFFEFMYDDYGSLADVEGVPIPRVGEFVHIASRCYVVLKVTHIYDKMVIHIIVERV